MLVTVCVADNPYRPDTSFASVIPGMKLVWQDEFTTSGRPDSAKWRYETGFVRNKELQWYQAANAACTAGVLRIEGRKDSVLNPQYLAGSADWRKNREYAQYTSASLKTSQRMTWQYGRLIVRARIDAQPGSWPAIWTMGSAANWPECGEVDIMEFYPWKKMPSLRANIGWGSEKPLSPTWKNGILPVSDLLAKDKDWIRKFHIWEMDWTRERILLKLDGSVINSIELTKTINKNGSNPFQELDQFLLLNLAIGGVGGDPSAATFPMVFEVDYVRLYQKND